MYRSLACMYSNHAIIISKSNIGEGNERKCRGTTLEFYRVAITLTGDCFVRVDRWATFNQKYCCRSWKLFRSFESPRSPARGNNDPSISWSLHDPIASYIVILQRCRNNMPFCLPICVAGTNGAHAPLFQPPRGSAMKPLDIAFKKGDATFERRSLVNRAEPKKLYRFTVGQSQVTRVNQGENVSIERLIYRRSKCRICTREMDMKQIQLKSFCLYNSSY